MIILFMIFLREEIFLKRKKNVLPFIIDVCIILKNIVLYSRITEVSTYSIVAKYIKV